MKDDVEELALLLEIVEEAVTSPRRTIAFDILTFNDTLFQLGGTAKALSSA